MLLTRSRAAVLCLGGWGLQTMLHLWPRLRFIQEERYDIGIDQQIPDLNRLTAFATIMPHPCQQPTEHEYVPFQIVRPSPGLYPEPFYVESQLYQIEQQTAHDSHSTYAERIAAMLFQRAINDKVIEELPSDMIRAFQQRFMQTEPLARGQRMSRQKMFKIGIACAESVARTMIRHVVDLTRLDSVQPRDPLVQTNLYVVASLTEPLASALIWPIVSELVANLGQRSVVNVIAILATGSFALDDTRVVEEAATHAAMVELEALTSIRAPSRRIRDALCAIIKGSKPGWEQRIGQQLFHRIYLIDREKSNQALARDALELAVLAGNAIESFLVADGFMHIEAQLGPDAERNWAAPYSLLGAANDYVPLAQYLLSAIEEERKRIVRESFLVELADSDKPQATLEQLRATPDEAIRNLLHPRTKRMFEDQAPELDIRRLARRAVAAMPILRGLLRTESLGAADGLPNLRVARAYILPRPIAEQLRQESAFWRWRTAAERRFTEVAQAIQDEIEHERFEASWGLTYFSPYIADKDLPTALRQYRDKTWAARYQKDRRTIPATAFAILHRIVRDICHGTEGLMMARARLDQWIDEVEMVLDQQRAREPDALGDEWDEQYGNRLGTWQRDFVRAAGRVPHRAAIGVRVAMMGMFLAFLTVSWLLFERPAAPTPVQIGAVLAGCAAITALVGLLTYMASQWRIHRLKQRRIALAQDSLSHNANQIVQESLYRVYQGMLEELHLLRAPLQRTIETLERWSKPTDPPEIPPPNIEAVHLHLAHTDDEIWQRIKELIQQDQVNGKTCQDRLRESWQSAGSNLRNWQEPGSRLAQRVRMATELLFNQRELGHAVLLEARWRRLNELATMQAGQGTVSSPETEEQALERLRREVVSDLGGAAWCAYTTGSPNQLQGGWCTACLDPQQKGCPFSTRGQEQREREEWPPWSLAAIVREFADRATEHLIPQRRVFPGRSQFVRQIVAHYNIERLVCNQGQGWSGNGVDQRREFVEDIYARAKPSANFDVENTFSQHVLEIGFGVTAEGARSAFRQDFDQRGMALLSSHDPMSIAAVRTVNGLRLADLTLAARCRMEFLRLAEGDRALIGLLETDKDMEAMYGKDRDVIPYTENVLA